VNTTLTSVPGLRVGHAASEAGDTGCTVVLGPFRAVVDVRGLATGTREVGTLDPTHLVPMAHGIVLAGGSAFGLAAADGVMAWLEERLEGFDTGVARVPIVPAAVIFDLAEGRERPDGAMGTRACEAATTAPVPEGRVGAGAGATVGKWAGPEASSPGGLGSWALDAEPYRVAALVVTNALGDISDGTGTPIAGARGDDGTLLDARKALVQAPSESPLRDPKAGTNTTLAVVATDAPLSAVDLQRLARTAANALAARIYPVHTPFDGDVVFALSTAPEARETEATELLRLGGVAQAALEEAIIRSVRHPSP
jgi:L-aminopeptidase/D-esterase-like protein